MTNILDQIKEKLALAKKDNFIFLLMGQTGRGKSSTINSLIGSEVAPTNEFEPETAGVVPYESELKGVKLKVYDTPGLCDDLEIKQNDDLYIDLIHKNIEKFDCLWFVSRLDETRVTNDEKRAILLITGAFGEKVWNHAIIVFTFACNVPSEKFELTLAKRTELIRREIENCTNAEIASNVQSVAVDNKNQFLPNGKEWLGELYTQTFLSIDKRGLTPFFLATSERINLKNKRREKSEENKSEKVGFSKNKDTTNYTPSFTSSKINLNEEQANKIQKRMDADVIGGLALAGATIGTAFGPAGTVVGGIIGGAIGAIAWFFS